MQDPNHWLSKCGKCKAAKNLPCRNRDGSISEHVHHGRPYWSEIASRKPFKIQGRGREFLCDNLEEFAVVSYLMPGTPLPPDDERKVLFPATDICIDCGERYPDPPLLKRCEKNHEQLKVKTKFVAA